METNEKLYHFCSMDAFRSIIENKAMRFTDARKMKDTLEIQYGAQAGIDACVNSWYKAGVIGFMGVERSAKIIFISCFSKDSEDSPYLWGNREIRLEFDRKKVEEWIKTLHGKCEDIAYYTGDELKSYMQKQYNDKQNTNTPDYVAHTLEESLFIKRKDLYEKENETRCAFEITTPICEYFPCEVPIFDEHDYITKSIKIHACQKNLYPLVLYCDIPFPKEMLTGVTIHNESNLTLPACKEFLAFNGFYDTTIRFEKLGMPNEYRTDEVDEQ